MMLSIDEKRDFLKVVPMFRSLSEKQLMQLADLCETLVYQAGKDIFRQGEIGGALFIIVEGQVLVQREVVRKTSTVSLNVVKSRQHFGEMTLFSDSPYSVTATVLKKTILLRVQRSSFVEFARDNPGLLIELNQVLSQRLEEAYDKISEITRSRKPRELRNLYKKLDF
jgi:CRP-like cAMP-binding protein